MRSSPLVFPRGTRRAPEPSDNPGTVFASVADRPLLPLEPASAFGAFAQPLRVCARDSRERIFVAITEDGRTCRHQLLAPGEVAIIGRHSRCDLRVSDPSLSLRHLAVAVSAGSTAADPFVRVWDLATGEPFATEDGVDSRAVTSTGPCFLGLRGSSIAIIPLSSLPDELPIGTRALWDSLPVRSIVTRLTGELEPKRQERRAQTITRVRGPIELSRTGCAPELAVGSLTVVGDGTTTTYHLGEDELARGILVGRYERCTRSVSPASVSRVHLLIARLGVELLAIDTASTNGSALADGGDFEVARLEGGAEIALAASVLVRWQPRVLGHHADPGLERGA
jgi:hypothetical protein